MSKCGHRRVGVGHLKHVLVVGSRVSIVDHGALVAGKLRSDRIDHLRAEVREATMSIITSMISDEVSLIELLLHLLLLLNFVHFSGER